MTVGSIKECVRSLWKGQIERAFIIGLSIKQLQGNYWLSDVV